MKDTFELLKKQFNSSDSAAINTLEIMKSQLTKQGLLIPSLNDGEFTMSRYIYWQGETLEIGALVAIHNTDIQAFELYLNLLKQFYAIKDSPLKLKILGINLLRLLAQVKISKFHIELISISSNDIKNPLIAFPVKIEQCLMEGSYNRIFKDALPCYYS